METVADIPELTALPDRLAPDAARASRLVDFYELTKPRMNFLVVVTTAVGYYMAVQDAAQWLRLLHAIFGTALTAAGASVLNQYVERGYDALMPRTANRPLPGGRIQPIEALFLGVMLGCSGVVYLSLFVNPLTAALGAITLASYVFLYTPLKRWTTLCTVVGAIPGAIPPVMGFTAVHGGLSPGAVALFAILFFWQTPHFLAIAILYRRDYALAGFKMLPVVDNDMDMTGRQIILYASALIPVSLTPVYAGVAGQLYFVIAVFLGLAFLTFGVSCAATKARTDARKLFFASIIYLPALLGVMMFDRI